MSRRRETDSFDEVADLARNGYRLASRIAEMVNIETKAYTPGQLTAAPDPVIKSLPFTWSSTTNEILNDPSQGDADFQRIGDSIKIHRVNIRGTVLKPSTLECFVYRTILYWDEGNTSPSGNDVLYFSMLGSIGATSSMKDYDKRKNTRILHDETYTIGTPAATSTGLTANYHHFHIHKKIGLHTQFEAGTQTIVTGALRLMIISNISASVQCYYMSEIQYTDD